MNYEVVLTDEADRNVRSILAWYVDRTESAASRWYHEYTTAVAALSNEPTRYGLARENEKFPIELRQFVFGCGRRKTHRIIYAVRPDRVVIYAVRHVAQQGWRAEDEPLHD